MLGQLGGDKADAGGHGFHPDSRKARQIISIAILRS
jgi:hypothetical protein